MVITAKAKREAKDALRQRYLLPKRKKFGTRVGIDSAKKIISQSKLEPNMVRRVALFHLRFKNRTSPKIEGALKLWGGRDFGKKAIKYYKEKIK